MIFFIIFFQLINHEYPNVVQEDQYLWSGLPQFITILLFLMLLFFKLSATANSSMLNEKVSQIPPNNDEDEQIS